LLSPVGERAFPRGAEMLDRIRIRSFLFIIGAGTTIFWRLCRPYADSVTETVALDAR